MPGLPFYVKIAVLNNMIHVHRGDFSGTISTLVQKEVLVSNCSRAALAHFGQFSRYQHCNEAPCFVSYAFVH